MKSTSNEWREPVSDEEYGLLKRGISQFPIPPHHRILAHRVPENQRQGDGCSSRQCRYTGYVGGKFATCPVEVDDVKMTLQIVKAHSDNRSIRKRLFRASLSRDYLLELLRALEFDAVAPMCVSFHGNGDFQVDWRWGEWHVGTIIGMEKNA